MAEFGRPDRHRKDVQNALILIWQENVIWRAFFMIHILVTLRGCSDGRIWSSGQTLTRCPECSDLDLSRKCHLEIISDVKFIGGLWQGFRMAEFGRPDRHSNDAPNLISKPSTLHCKDYVSARGRLRMSETRQRHKRSPLELKIAVAAAK